MNSRTANLTREMYAQEADHPGPPPQIVAESAALESAIQELFKAIAELSARLIPVLGPSQLNIVSKDAEKMPPMAPLAENLRARTEEIRDAIRLINELRESLEL